MTKPARMSPVLLLLGLGAVCWSVGHAGAAAEAAAEPNAAAPGDQLNEVPVTARRRSDRLTDVPIAMVAQSAEQLEHANVTNLRDLQTVAPGLVLTTGDPPRSCATARRRGCGNQW